MKALALRVESKCKELSEVETDKLITRLHEAFAVTAEKMLEIAAIVRLLDDRGQAEILDSIKLPMLPYFRRIAYGQVLPEVFERYRHNAKLLDVVASLPIPDQQRLSQSCAIPVLTITADGEPTERRVDPAEMSGREIRQVFSRGKLRSLSEQRSYLEDRATPKRLMVQEIENGVKYNRRKRTLILHGEFSPSQLLSYLARVED